MVGLVPLEEETPESLPVLSPPCEDPARRWPPAAQVENSHQERVR